MSRRKRKRQRKYVAKRTRDADALRSIFQLGFAFGAPCKTCSVHLIAMSDGLAIVKAPDDATTDELLDLISAAELDAMSDSDRDAIAAQFRCRDCEADTLELREYYTVLDELWRAHGVPSGMLCIGCFELRLGRQLTPADFAPVAINTPTHRHPKSERLLSRLRGDMP